jgi:hypothetical protein
MRYAGHEGRMGIRVLRTGILGGNPENRDHYDDLGIDGMITLKLILKKWNGRAWTGLVWFRIGTRDGLL